MRSQEYPLTALVALMLLASPSVAQQSQARQPAANPSTVAMTPTRHKWTHEQIVDAQRGLAAARLYQGKIDGMLGRETEAAIREYQKAHRLTVDGQLNDDLLARLRAESKPMPATPTSSNQPTPLTEAPRPMAPTPAAEHRTEMARPMTHTWLREDIVAAQQGLSRAKLYHGTPTGTLDQPTMNAIREFQRLHGLPVTGELSEALLAQLRAVK